MRVVSGTLWARCKVSGRASHVFPTCEMPRQAFCWFVNVMCACDGEDRKDIGRYGTLLERLEGFWIVI
jgi:hypothetical protein